jgi:hypothetical protein
MCKYIYTYITGPSNSTLFRVTIIWESQWQELSAEEREKIKNNLPKNIPNVSESDVKEITKCSGIYVYLYLHIYIFMYMYGTYGCNV